MVILFSTRTKKVKCRLEQQQQNFLSIGIQQYTNTEDCEEGERHGELSPFSLPSAPCPRADSELGPWWGTECTVKGERQKGLEQGCSHSSPGDSQEMFGDLRLTPFKSEELSIPRCLHNDTQPGRVKIIRWEGKGQFPPCATPFDLSLLGNSSSLLSGIRLAVSAGRTVNFR